MCFQGVDMTLEKRHPIVVKSVQTAENFFNVSRLL